MYKTTTSSNAVRFKRFAKARASHVNHANKRSAIHNATTPR
ncbi:hypothetical protein T01_1901 [Trichinella spiralis]|uniref:Uncharacterized protein n=1 Tax=Trichinella spiralis TaxID=6334 RepID=A0A0V1AIE9_TRISP|nr:hypothetical protein T01_1901 [Trichinella spiralis]